MRMMKSRLSVLFILCFFINNTLMSSDYNVRLQHPKYVTSKKNSFNETIFWALLIVGASWSFEDELPKIVKALEHNGLWDTLFSTHTLRLVIDAATIIGARKAFSRCGLDTE